MPKAKRPLVARDGTLEAQVAVRTAELEAAHAHIRLILQSTADGLYGIDGAGRFSFVNPAACRLLGYAEEQLIGRPADAILHPGHAEPCPQADGRLHQRLSAGASVRFDQAVYWRADGQPLPVAVAGQPMWKDGKVVGGVVSFTDISDRNRAEAEREAAVASLRASEERYRLLVEQTVDGIFVADAKGCFLDVNPACSAMLGYTPGEICRMAIADVISPEEAARIDAEMARLANGIIVNSEWLFRRKDGSLFLGEARCRQLPDGRLQAILRDITQRKAVETALRDSQRDLERAQSLGRIGSWRQDVSRNVLIWSDENRRIFGLPKGTTLSYETFLERVHPEDRAYVDACWQAALRGEPYTIEHRIVVDGAVKWVREIAELEVAADGTLLGGFGTTQDISAQKAILAELERAKEAADAANRAKSEFLANMSHEIRTPLNAVLGLAQAGWRDNAGRDSQGTFSRILQSGQLLLNLINDILDFSKIEADKLELERIPFDLGEVIDQAVDMNAARTYQKGLEFRLDEAADLPARCVGDPLRLSQVLLNLLSNAVKFTERGHIGLAVGWEDGTLVCVVSDTGIGMDEGQLGRLFAAFEQADGSTTRRFGGTGLGLAICSRLVGLMGGTISAESQPGLGSVFSLRLPLPSLPAPPPVRPGPKVVLVGLADADAFRLEQGLAARGMATVRLDVEAAFGQEDAAMIVLPEAALVIDNPLNTQALMSAIGKRQRLLIIHTPGAKEAAPLDGRLCLERPLRARHILAALRATPVAQAEAGRPARLAGYTLLAAEDNDMNRLVLEELLRGEGARLDCVENGRLAVERIRQDGPDAYALVLMDMQMPEMDGHGATRRIRALAPDLPVVGLTAHAFAEEAERCRASGMVAHMTKPVDLDALVAVILRHARRPRPAGADAKPKVADAPDRWQGVGMVDWAALSMRYSNMPGFVEKLAALAVGDHADASAKLRAAAACADYSKLVFTAHLLKGVSGNLCARGVMSLATQTEQAARVGQAEALGLAENLALAVEALLGELASRIQ